MSCPTVPKKLQLRRDLKANWTSSNPVLGPGELGIETDTNSFKIGNGVADWNSLPYFSGGLSTTGGIIDGGNPSSTYVGDPLIDFGGVV